LGHDDAMVKKSRPYERFKKSDLILRDELAIDRTVLSNESTLLAYIRLAITLVIAGISIVHFAMEKWFETIGVLCVPIGILVGILGWHRYQKMAEEITIVRKPGPRKK
jgi:putative membrane protein